MCDFGQNLRFLKHYVSLVYDLLADFGDANFVLGAALEQTYAEFFFEFLDGDTQRWLTDEAGLCRFTEMIFLRNGDYVTKFGQCHNGFVIEIRDRFCITRRRFAIKIRLIMN